jgi:hypothetical protein
MQAAAALSVVAGRSLSTIETSGIAQVIVCGGEAITVDRKWARGPGPRTHAGAPDGHDEAADHPPRGRAAKTE